MKQLAFILFISIFLSGCSKSPERIFDEKGQARPTEHASNGEKKCHSMKIRGAFTEENLINQAKTCKVETSQKICEFYFPKELCAG